MKLPTDDELRVKVAELCEWTRIHIDEQWLPDASDGYTYPTLVGVPKGRLYIGSASYEEIPNYPRDLNAMHGAIEALGPENMKRFCEVCLGICRHSPAPYWLRATARQLAEAYVITRGAK